MDISSRDETRIIQITFLSISLGHQIAEKIHSKFYYLFMLLSIHNDSEVSTLLEVISFDSPEETC